MRRQLVNRRQEDRSRRKRRDSSCECYCKLKETNDEVSIPSSQRFIEKNNPNKCEKTTARTTTIDLDIESPIKQQFETNILESPMLSPDTQKAIENAEQILEEVRYKITEAAKMSTTGFSRGIRKELYMDDLEPPLEDEIEENLYIRELVSSRLNKINNENSEDSNDSTNSKKIIKSKAIKKRSIDLLAPKFRTMEHRFRDTLYQPTNHHSASFKQNDSENSKIAVSSEIKSDDLSVDTKTHKTKSLTIQKGPPLSIDRELKKQDLGFIHISPDTSYVENNTNINFYSFFHESCKKKDEPLKNMRNEQDEILIDNVTTDIIGKLDRSTSENQKLTEKIKIFEEKSFVKDDVAILTDSVGKTDDVLFESPINNGRGNKDQGNVSEHLPRTGADYFTLKDEPNSYYSNGVRKNEENVHCGKKGITQKICCRDVGIDVQNSLSKDEKNDTIQFSCDDKDSHYYYYEEGTKDEVTKIHDDIEKCRKKEMADDINPMKNIKTIHERDLNQEFHEIDKRFSNILTKHDPNGKLSNKSDKFNEEKENTNSSDTSLQETDISFNDIELKAPSIETFDNILLVYDKVIDRVSKSEKKIGDTLRRLELSLSSEPLQPIITNTTIESYDLLPCKKTDNFRNTDKNDPILLLSDKSKSSVVDCKEDKFDINPCMSNYVFKKNVSSFLEKKNDIKNESRLIKKRSSKISDTVGSNESSSSIENIVDKSKILDNYESRDHDAHVEPLMLKNEKWREKKFEFERAIVNKLSNVDHTSPMLEDIIKHLQTFSNTQDVQTIFKNFIMDVMNRESGLVFDFLSIEKQDDDTASTGRIKNESSLKAIAQNDEGKIQKDTIIDFHVLQEPSLVHSSDRIVMSKEKSLKVCPVNLIEIKPTRQLIDELSQTEIELLEKGTQYEVSCEQNDQNGDDKIIKDVPSDKKSNEMKEDPTREIEMNNSDITKLRFVKNDDSERNSKSSETNIINMDSLKDEIMRDLNYDPNFSKKIHEKLSDSEDSSSRTNVTNVKRIYTNLSHFTTTSSETSHSEGELFLPSSCSYSLGEVRLGKNSTSVCNHALVSTNTQSYTGETTCLLRHSSGEIYVDSSDTL